MEDTGISGARLTRPPRDLQTTRALRRWAPVIRDTAKASGIRRVRAGATALPRTPGPAGAPAPGGSPRRAQSAGCRSPQAPLCTAPPPWHPAQPLFRPSGPLTRRPVVQGALVPSTTPGAAQENRGSSALPRLLRDATRAAHWSLFIAHSFYWPALRGGVAPLSAAHCPRPTPPLATHPKDPLSGIQHSPPTPAIAGPGLRGRNSDPYTSWSSHWPCLWAGN